VQTLKGEVARMKVIIDIPKQDYELACKYPEILFGSYAWAIKRGTPIPDNTTNGDMVKAMFPSLKIANDGLINDDHTGIMAFYGGYGSPLPRGDNYFNRKWWNAPYEEKRGNENGKN
jgi:hypothetical protein